MPPTTPTGAPPRDVHARALAWLLAKGFTVADAEATLVLVSPSEEGIGETEAVFLSMPRSSASR